MSAKPKAFETKRIRLNMKNANVHVVHINKVTAPEFLLIREIHGEGAATIAEAQGDDIETRMNESGVRLQRLRPPASLMDHLINKYGAERFKAVFPGQNPILPFTYEDAGILEGQSEDMTDQENGWEEIKVVTDETEVAAKKPVKPNAKKLDDLIGAPTDASAA